jgi:hypothetical protein
MDGVTSAWWRGGALFALVVVLEPQEREADDRNENVGPEDDAGIPRREIMLDDHMVDVNAGSAPQEGRGPEDGGEAHIEAAPAGNEADQAEAEAREADLELEG